MANQANKSSSNRLLECDLFEGCRDEAGGLDLPAPEAESIGLFF